MKKDLVDIQFYRNLYSDLRFIPDSKLQKHYTEMGVKEGRLPNLQVLEEHLNSLEYEFDSKFYREQYPDVPNNDVYAKVHFWSHGSKESRIYNRQQLPTVINTTTNSTPN